MYDTIIIGGGIAGFSAAMYAGRMKLKTLVITKIRGGTITNTNEVANWPGISRIEGIKLAENIEKHALEYDIEVVDDEAVQVLKKDGFLVKTSDEKQYGGKTIIFATGSEARKLGIPGEKEFFGRGVHVCALCDGYFYKDKEVAIIGGSDSATKEALLLAQLAKKVYIIYRKDKIRAEPVTYEKAMTNKKIEVITNTNVTEIIGGERVEKMVLDKPYKGKTEFPISGIFVEIGRISNSKLAESIGIMLTESGEIITTKDMKTNMDGAYAAGDVTDSRFKQAITGSAEGVSAVFSVYEYLQKKK